MFDILNSLHYKKNTSPLLLRGQGARRSLTASALLTKRLVVADFPKIEFVFHQFLDNSSKQAILALVYPPSLYPFGICSNVAGFYFTQSAT